ncbi:MAG: nucleotide exchange factor GrpE [Myxococcales bacterium]|nr:nucleotide exchange factor GrpE [Myxococcales bacterium]
MSDKKPIQADISTNAVEEALRAVEKTRPAPSKPTVPETGGVEIQVEGAASEEERGPSREELHQTIEKLREEAKAARERMLRIAADADNTRKRALRERDEGIRYGNEELLRELLPVADNLERSLSAISNDGANQNATAVRKGVEMIYDQLQALLKKFQVEGFSALGQPFDPNLHEAISRVECADRAPGTVLSEIHRGYRYRDRLLRPALVTVACAPAAAGAGAADPPAAKVPEASEPKAP